VATVTDSNLAATSGEFTATINWGDGTSSSGTISGSNGAFSITGSHAYADEGSYTLDVKIADHGAAVAEVTTGSATIADAPPTVTTPTIASNDSAGPSTVTQGDVLTASATVGSDDTVGYQWFSSADGFTNPIQSSGNMYTVQAGDVGNTIEVVAT